MTSSTEQLPSDLPADPPAATEGDALAAAATTPRARTTSPRSSKRRDELRAREKASRDDPNMTLRALQALERECVAELDAGDSVVKKIQASVRERAARVLGPLQEALSQTMGSRQSLKRLDDLVLTCEKELDPSDSLLERARALQSARRKSHRVPLETDAQTCFTHGELFKLRARAAAELSAHDPFLQSLDQRLASRESSHRSVLTGRFAKFMRDPAKVDTSEYSKLLADCERELDVDADPLIPQVRSALGVRLANKPTISLDALERGEAGRAQVDKTSPTAKKSKKSSSSKEARLVSPQRYSSSSSKIDSQAKGSAISSDASSSFGDVGALLKGFLRDIGTAEDLDDSVVVGSGAVYRLAVFAVLLLYAGVLVSLGLLTFRIATSDGSELSRMDITTSGDIVYRTLPPKLKSTKSGLVLPATGIRVAWGGSSGAAAAGSSAAAAAASNPAAAKPAAAEAPQPAAASSGAAAEGGSDDDDD